MEALHQALFYREAVEVAVEAPAGDQLEGPRQRVGVAPVGIFLVELEPLDLGVLFGAYPGSGGADVVEIAPFFQRAGELVAARAQLVGKLVAGVGLVKEDSGL